jgi:hypothetical protein
MWRAWIFLGVALAACAEFPEVDAALGERTPGAAYPALLPFETLLAANEPRLTDSDDATLRARAEALRNRANNLRGPVIDQQTRDRMDDGVTQP